MIGGTDNYASNDARVDPSTQACEIRVLASCAIKSALDEIAPMFERSHGVRVRVPYDPSSIVSKKLAGGVDFDVAIANISTFEVLMNKGLALAEPHVTFASTFVALGFRQGVTPPDVSSHEALKSVVMSARSISFSDPALGGGSSNFFADLVELLDIGAHVRGKAILTLPGEAGYPIGDGRAEFGVAQASELALVRGIACVPIFPEIPGSKSVYAAGISGKTSNADAARAFVEFLMSPVAKTILSGKWLAVD
jgi:molybdate transport system substrate-binding protein